MTANIADPTGIFTSLIYDTLGVDISGDIYLADFESAYNAGKITGDVISTIVATFEIIEGIAQIGGSIAVATGGAAVSSTGVGALVGVPVIVVSVEGVAVGAATATLGSATFLSSLQNLYDDVQSYNSSKNTWHKMTTKEADAAAKELGFQKTNYRSHGQPVYKKGNKYITPDTDGHNGGVWKMADSVENLGSKSTRMGTYDKNLKRIGD